MSERDDNEREFDYEFARLENERQEWEALKLHAPDDDLLANYAACRMSLAFEQSGGTIKEWPDTAVWFARELIKARRDLKDVKAIASSLQVSVNEMGRMFVEIRAWAESATEGSTMAEAGGQVLAILRGK